MKFALALFGVLAVVAAQEYQQMLLESYPVWYVSPESYQRQRRDVTFNHKTDNGRVFGTLGQNDAGLFGKSGYEHNFFDDNRGKLSGQAYGTRVLGPYGDSSHLGGALNWHNNNAAAALDVSKMIHGPTSVTAGAGGRWPVGDHGAFSLLGNYGKTGGSRSEFGGLAKFQYDF